VVGQTAWLAPYVSAVRNAPVILVDCGDPERVEDAVCGLLQTEGVRPTFVSILADEWSIGTRGMNIDAEADTDLEAIADVLADEVERGLLIRPQPQLGPLPVLLRAGGPDEPLPLLRQMGVGGIHSWGTTALPKYSLPYQDYTYRFILRPLRGPDDDPRELARQRPGVPSGQ